MSIPAFIPRASAAPEPRMVRVPEGWFWMGSDSGQDNERPVHRVWIDAFLLAACQVTNAEYARFLHAAGAAPPPHWSDPNFNHPDQRSEEHTSELQSLRHLVCRLLLEK